MRYLDQYRKLHSDTIYGTSGNQFVPIVRQAIHETNATSVLEYGCGQSALSTHFRLPWVKFDPAIPAFSHQPSGRFDLIINTDVMEHVPEDEEDEILRHIQSLGANILFNISLRLAGQILPNGENAHCNLKTRKAWLNTLSRHFANTSMVRYDPIERDALFVTWTPTTLHRSEYRRRYSAGRQLQHWRSHLRGTLRTIVSRLRP
ncbi:MAG TPA: methyltransferase domain-containing protein [Opitutaceae bacterium]|nr:methyltransferase domain-containing protein [Opitutaceae bacterium]